ncbi:hypothetical protein ThvES_00014180 [Thiovulum sp. ES]|nr:hypothetical protein ThvES_00014180 [Thiovulum sp. ES]
MEKNSEKINGSSLTKAENLVWSGSKTSVWQNYYSFKFVTEIAKRNLPKLEPKGEFEKTSHFEERKKLFEKENLQKLENQKEELLNSWLGKQNIEMKYNADKEFFNVSVNGCVKNSALKDGAS